MGIATRDEATAFFSVPPDQQGRLHAWAARLMGDEPTELDIWARLSKDEDDLGAAVRESEARIWAGDKKVLADLAALKARTGRVLEKWRGEQGHEAAERELCFAEHWFGEDKQARSACDAARAAAPGSLGLMTLAELELLSGANAKALVDAEAALHEDAYDVDLWFVLGAANDALGNKELAVEAWSKALASDPSHEPTLRSLKGLDTSGESRMRALASFRRNRRVGQLAACAASFMTLGMPERAQRCIGRLRQVEPLEARAVSLELGEVKSAAAAQVVLDKLAHEARAAKKAAVLVRAARIQERLGSEARAKALAQEALRLNPVLRSADELLESLGESSTLPTVERKWELATQSSSKTFNYVAPFIHHVTLMPYGVDPMPEADGLADALAKRFPGIEFSMEKQRPLPPELDADAVDASALFLRMPDEAGRVALVDRDLMMSPGAWRYGVANSLSSMGVVSVARFRSAKGHPAVPPQQSVSPTDRALAKSRLEGQVTSTVAKILGMSFPCPQEKCVLRFPRRMEEFDAKGTEFCELHKKELSRIMQSLKGP